MMMSIISSLFIFCFCLYLSSHACNARRLEVIGNGGFGRQLVSSSKEAEKVKLNMDSTKKGAEKKGDSSIGNYHSSHGGGGAVVVTQKPKESKAFEKEMKYTEDAISSGNAIVESSSHVGLLKATKTEEVSGWRARTVLDLGSDHDLEEEEEDTYKKSVNEEDTVRKDYEPPHRNSPIHNK